MILLLVIATAALACQKEELPNNPENPPEPEKNYYPLTTGSYWNFRHPLNHYKGFTLKLINRIPPDL